MEQIPLDLAFNTAATPAEAEMTEEELLTAYKATVGIDPTWRGFTRDEMLEALKDPAAELVRISELDHASDQDDMFKTYRR